MDKAIRWIKKNRAQAVMVLLANLFFCLAVYLESTWFSQWVTGRRQALMVLAQGTLLHKVMVLLLVLVGLGGVPLLIYVFARSLVADLIAKRPFSWGDLTPRLWSALRWWLAVGLLVFIWAQVMAVFRQEVLPWMVLITGVPLLFWLFYWSQARWNEEGQRVLASIKHIWPLVKGSKGLIGLGLFIALLITLLFYLGGSLWAGSFGQVGISDTAWLFYTGIFRWVWLAVVLCWISLAQIVAAKR